MAATSPAADGVSSATESTPAVETGSLAACLAQAQELTEKLSALRLPRLFAGAWPLALVLVAMAMASVPAGLLAGWTNFVALGAAAGGAAVVISVVLGVLFPRCRSTCREIQHDFARLAAEAEAVQRGAVAEADALRQQQEAANIARRDEAMQAADATYKQQSAELSVTQEKSRQQAADVEQETIAAATSERDRAVAEADARYRPRLAQLPSRQQAEIDELEQRHAERSATIEKRYRRGGDEVASRWQAAQDAFTSAAREMQESVAPWFPDWNAVEPEEHQLPEELPPALRIGKISVDLTALPGGLPSDERSQPATTQFTLPACLPFPERPSLVVLGDDAARRAAIAILQNTMLRLLTGLPSGKVRFTIIDPVGLGENFSAFMHLADFDESLVNKCIWTEPAHIEERLAELSEHLSSVIQKYLRNEYATIAEYNAQAGEVAEPFHVLVVADFPTGFSEAAAARLVSIANSGPRCGVYTLLGVDQSRPLPHGFDLSALADVGTHLVWRKNRFVWRGAGFDALPVEFDAPPADAAFNALVRRAGESAQDALRVEVPFDVVTPDDDELWQADCREELAVPLGRAGAARLQYLKLGRGTSQHVLVSGKTGSGKSTLWHALITNIALYYPPDEVQLYLIDFKKGVEFKAYASQRLPHARWAALESDREFGLSVLERLDAELKQRGDRFREAGVQDIKAFRAAHPDEPLPRLLLIVDEFQELFTEDDRVAQDAALLLDRLVRQGRAFGMHVLLGSQTLAGAYSLARSTIGQMAVRVALQCSEADAHLILSEDNTAARLLRRPGEAIYNDANGLFEGNHPFQVVWLSDDRRDAYLDKVAQLAATRDGRYGAPIVFEGNVPADPRDNQRLEALLANGSTATTASPPKAWLGAAVAIKEPTRVEFARQSGSNLLLVGAQPQAALGVLSTSLVSLAAQRENPQADGQIDLFIFDGTRADDRLAGRWQHVADALGRGVETVAPRQVPAAMGQLTAELNRRQQQDDDRAPPVFVVVHDLARFRALRREEDDFGFGATDSSAQPSPAKQLAELLREGPPLGMHTLVWCDTYTNLTRWMDRAALRDFELVVAFQMSANDASSLIDSPTASRLGVHRALLADHTQGSLEKFRPYAAPTAEWLADVGARLIARRSRSEVI